MRRPQTGAAFMRGDVTLLPFFLRHRLVRDGIMGVGALRALGEHPQMLTQGHQGRQHLDGEGARRTLRCCRDRGGRVLVEFAGRDQ